MKHDISKLPKWAQEHIEYLNRTITEARFNLSAVSNAHGALANCSTWFTVPNMQDKPFTLFLLQNNHAQPMCSLAPNDRLLVIRPKGEGK